MRSDDGVAFKDRTPIKIDDVPRDIGVTLYGDWIYLACLAGRGNDNAIHIWRSQDGRTYERFAELKQTSQAYAGVRIATLGPDLYVVARESTNGLRLWSTVWNSDGVDFSDRGLLPSITSVAMPSFMGLA
jgi:hypothetical protein